MIAIIDLEWVLPCIWIISLQVSFVLVVMAILAKLYIFDGLKKIYYWLHCLLLIRVCVPVHFTLPTEKIPEGVWLPVVKKSTLIQPSISNNISFVPQNTSVTYSTSEVIFALWFFLVSIGIGIFITKILWQNYKLSKYESCQQQEINDLLQHLCHKMGIERSIGLVFCDYGPCIVGIRKPTILLPKTVAEWPLEDLEPILAHELTHFQRGDLWINTLQNLVQIVYFFHPLVWFLNSQIRKWREFICDEKTVSILSQGCKKHYCQVMLKIAESKLKTPHWEPALYKKETLLEKRIKAMLAKKNSSRVSRIAILLFGFVLATSTVVAQNQAFEEYRFSLKKVFTNKNFSITSPKNWQYDLLRKVLLNISGVKKIKNSQTHISVLCRDDSVAQINKTLDFFSKKKQLYNISLHLIQTKTKAKATKNFHYVPIPSQKLHNILNYIRNSKDAKSMQAPSLTFFHGQQSYIAVFEQTTYIEKYTEQMIDKDYVVNPITKLVNEGLIFECCLMEDILKNKWYIKTKIKVSELEKITKVNRTLKITQKKVKIEIPLLKSWEYEKEITVDSLPCIFQLQPQFILNNKPTQIILIVRKGTKTLKH